MRLVSQDIKDKQFLKVGSAHWLFWSFVLFYFIISIIGAFHHEMWRDELQHWLLARDSKSISDVFERLHYEGLPGLWPLILYFLSQLLPLPISMQIFHSLMATVNAALIMKYAPFTLLQRLMLCFGYFLFFEYNLICRAYVLGVFFIFLFLVLYSRKVQNRYLYLIILILLCQTTIYGVIAACALTMFYILDAQKHFTNGHRNRYALELLIFMLLFGCGVATAGIQMLPAPDCGYNAIGWRFHWDSEHFIKVLTIPFRAILPLPAVSDLHLWNKNIVDLIPSETLRSGIMVIGSLMLLSLLTGFFRKNRPVLVFFIAGSAAFLLFAYVKYYGYARHHGHLFLFIVASYWLSAKPLKRIGIKNRIRNTGFFEFKGISFNIILLIHLLGGIYFYCIDFQRPFSASKNAAWFIKQGGFEHYTIAGTMDYTLIPIAGYLDREIYYLEHGTFGRSIMMKSSAMDIYMKNNFGCAKDLAVAKIKNFTSPLLLILNCKLDLSKLAKDNPNVKQVAEFLDTIVPSERWWIYTVND